MPRSQVCPWTLWEIPWLRRPGHKNKQCDLLDELLVGEIIHLITCTIINASLLNSLWLLKKMDGWIMAFLAQIYQKSWVLKVGRQLIQLWSAAPITRNGRHFMWCCRGKWCLLSLKTYFSSPLPWHHTSPRILSGEGLRCKEKTQVERGKRGCNLRDLGCALGTKMSRKWKMTTRHMRI